MEKTFPYRNETSQKISLERIKKWHLRFMATCALALLSYIPMSEFKPVIAQSVENATSSPDIFNGREANEQEQAFSVRIRLGSKLCSGFIIDSNTIGTARHCTQDKDDKNTVVDIDPSRMIVRLDGDSTDHLYEVSKVIKVGQEIYINNDQAVLILKESIIFNETIKPISIVHTSMIDKFPLLVEGHGGSELGKFTQESRVGNQTLHPEYPPGLWYMYPNMIWTQNQDLTTDEPIVFLGDSGGPLFVYVDAPYYVEEEDKLYMPGYYAIAVTTYIVGLPVYGENGEPSPYMLIGFHTLVDKEIQAEINNIKEERPLFDEKTLISSRNRKKY